MGASKGSPNGAPVIMSELTGKIMKDDIYKNPSILGFCNLKRLNPDDFICLYGKAPQILGYM